MESKKRLYWAIVLLLSVLACQTLTTATPSPIATQEPAATEKEVSPTVTPTKKPAPIATRTASVNNKPVIQSVDLREETSKGEMTVFQDITFHDADGDVNFINYEIVDTTEADVHIEGGEVRVSTQKQISGAVVTGSWNCGRGNYEVTLRATLHDRKGNRSKPSEYTIVCGLGAAAQKGFPDTFDDNRNEWELDENVEIKDGKLQFRNIPTGMAQWVWCDHCKVTEDQNYVSVESSWSKTPDAALGLLLDSGLCNPDGLIFVIGPFQYYRIMQTVRDNAGEWKHWRPFIEWQPSSLIRKAQNATNKLSALYEFSDELHISLYINDKRVTRVRVYGYNDSKECQPGLFSDSGLDANFDNFNISAEGQ